MEMTMNLPRNYVEIEEEEMMYLEGGYRFNMSIGAFTFWADVIIGGISCGVSCWMSYRNMVRALGKNKVKGYIVKCVTRAGYRKEIGKKIANYAVGLLQLSIGAAIAFAFDCFDRSGRNGRIQF